MQHPSLSRTVEPEQITLPATPRRQQPEQDTDRLTAQGPSTPGRSSYGTAALPGPRRGRAHRPVDTNRQARGGAEPFTALYVLWSRAVLRPEP